MGRSEAIAKSEASMEWLSLSHAEIRADSSRCTGQKAPGGWTLCFLSGLWPRVSIQREGGDSPVESVGSVVSPLPEVSPKLNSAVTSTGKLFPTVDVFRS